MANEENVNKETKEETAQASPEAQKAAEDVRNIVEVMVAKDGQPKYKSWLLWVSVISLAVLSVKLVTGNDYTDTANNITTIVFAALSALGIVNNPNSNTSL